jgi:polysaccharide biosynthesis protein PslH
VRLLIATLGPPVPADRGARVRDLELLRRLGLHHEVTVLAILGSTQEAAALKELEGAVNRVEWVADARAPGRPAARVLRAAYGTPIASVPFLPRQAARRFAQLISDEHPDLIQIEHSFLAPLVDAIPAQRRPPVVLSLHNVGDRQYASMAASRSRRDLVRVGSRVKHALVRSLERRYLGRFDLVLVVSEPEREAVRALEPGVAVEVIENGVDTDRLLPLEEADRASVLFVANLAYRPNVDGAVWLCARVVPALRALRPGAEVRIVGPAPPRRLRGLARRRGVAVTGLVPDVVPHYRWARVAVAPIHSGGGTRMKILEAMALGRPVVSTRLGCDGLEAEDGRHLLVADRAGDFARQIAALLEDAQLRERLCREGRRLVERRYSWQRSADKLLTIYERLATT